VLKRLRAARQREAVAAAELAPRAWRAPVLEHAARIAAAVRTHTLCPHASRLRAWPARDPRPAGVRHVQLGEAQHRAALRAAGGGGGMAAEHGAGEWADRGVGAFKKSLRLLNKALAAAPSRASVRLALARLPSHPQVSPRARARAPPCARARAPTGSSRGCGRRRGRGT